ncbi:hypothetical protein PM082_021019 [Marasmius tenuissimus]|nr:hypothetical protein PM082_021019 [Marasmius tenuissimus]
MTDSHSIFLTAQVCLLAGNYAAVRAPAGLKRLIISNSPASTELLERGTDSLLKSQFLPDIYDMIEKREREGTTDEKDYQDVVGQFMRKHVCTVDPWPAVFLQSLGELEKDNTVYHTMWGPSEFSITGTMRGWTIIDILHRISAPLDEVQSIAVMPWFLNVPKVKWVELQNSTHLAQFEEPEKYFDVILAFLERS